MSHGDGGTLPYPVSDARMNAALKADAAKTVTQISDVLKERAPEVRVTNEKTGGQKGSKARRFSLLPWRELGDVAKHYAAGARKYAAHNWRKGYDWSLSADALLRHFELFWEHRESLDPEMEQYTDDGRGTHHLAAVIFHALALMFFEKWFPELDDRPPTPASIDDDDIVGAR